VNRYERRTARARASHAAKNSSSHVVAIQGAIIPARTLTAGNPTINKKNRDGKAAEWLALGADSSPDAILADAAEQGLFEIGKQESDAEPKKPRKQLQGDAGMLDTIATGLSGLALFQATQGQITGSAAENFWNAFGAERMLGSSVVAAGFGLLGLYQLLQGQWLGSASSLFFYALAGHQLATFQQAPSATTDLSEPPKPPRKQRKPPRKKRGPQKAGERLEYLVRCDLGLSSETSERQHLVGSRTASVLRAVPPTRAASFCSKCTILGTNCAFECCRFEQNRRATCPS
jgi:hypothetical protein